MFYKNQDVLAYSVEIKEMQDNVIKGNIYEIDYLSQYLLQQKNTNTVYFLIFK